MPGKKNKINLDFAIIDLRPDNIVQVQYSDDLIVDMPEVKKIVEAIGTLAGEKRVCVLKIMGRYTSVTLEARKFVAEGEGSRYSIAEAVVISSLPQWLLANFFIKKEKPVKPMRFFKNTKDAEKWLSSQSDLLPESNRGLNKN